MIEKRDNLIGATAFAEMFQISVKDVRRMIRQGLLPGISTHDNKVLIDLSDLLKASQLERLTPRQLVWRRNIKSLPPIKKPEY